MKALRMMKYPGRRNRDGVEHAVYRRAFQTACLRWFFFSGFLAGALAVQADSGGYRTAASILALKSQEAERASPVVLRGVVTGSTDFGFFVQDQTAGIWVDRKLSTDLTSGDEVEVKGQTGPGLFSPIVAAQSVRKLGRAPLPQPRKVTFERLFTGDEDAQYVSITGVVRSAWIRPNLAPAQKMWLKISDKESYVFATLPEKDAAAANGLIGATIRIDAPATCTKNQNRQITWVVLPVAGIQHVTVIHPPPGDLFAAPILPIDRLMQYRSETDPDHRVRVTGTVTYYRPGENLFLEEGGSGLLVSTGQISAIKPGDRIDVVGFPALAPAGPFLQDAVFRYAGNGDPQKAKPISIDDLSSGKFNNTLVSIEGQLLRITSEPYGQVLLLHNGTAVLRADLDDGSNPDVLKRVQEGSIVRLTGISVLDVEGSWNEGGPGASEVHYRILLRSLNDVETIQPPSWWTTTHLLYIAVMLTILVFVFFALALYSRREHWKLEAVLKERERMAHEIHDTLSQSFAGIGFQVQAISRAIPEDLPQLRKQVDLARALVQHSHKEARRTIEPEHLDSLDDVDLLSALEASARKMVEGGSVVVSTERSGMHRRLPGKIADELLRIGQEAVANAVRHSSLTHLVIILAYAQDSIRLSISDDGCGFVESADLLGFGLRGMRKRSDSISAALDIISSPKKGTLVRVDCPLPPVSSFATFFQRKLKFFSRH